MTEKIFFLTLIALSMLAGPSRATQEIVSAEDGLRLPVNLPLLPTDSAMYEFLTQERLNECEDYEYNAARQIPRLYENGQLDSILLVLNFWERYCGRRAIIRRMRMLLTIHRGEFSEKFYDREIITELLRYRKDVVQRYRLEYLFRGIFMDEREELEEFVERLARDCKKRYTADDIEYLWCLFYLREFDEFYLRLTSDVFQETDLRRYYDQRIEYLERNAGSHGHYSGRFDIWAPSGDLEIVGDHPSLGVSLGGIINDWQIDLVFDIRVNKSKNPYTIDNKGLLDTTSNFSTFFIGGELSRKVFALGKAQIEGLLGLGYEVLNSVDDRNDDEKAIRLGTLNAHTGAAIKLFFNREKSWYVRLAVRHNWLDFNNDKGSSLEGNAVTFGISIGGYASNNIDKELRDLNYFVEPPR